MPTKEPSQVLFNLLGMLIQAGEKMGSVTEALSGENPGQNQPFSTTSAVMEQGMQVFLGIYKRVYRSLTKEFRMLYRLNHMYLGVDAYNDLLDDPQGKWEPSVDFDPEGLDIVPEADPSLANSMRKQRRVQALIEAQRAGMTLNKEYVTKVFLEAIDEPEVELAMEKNPGPPSKEELEQKRFEAEMAFKEKELQVRMSQNANHAQADMAKAMEHMAKAKALEGEVGLKQMELALAQMVERNKNAMENEKLLVNVYQKINDQKIEHAKNQAANSNSGGATSSS